MLGPIETWNRPGYPAISAGLLLFAATLSAAEPADPLADLAARVAQLEQDNRALRESGVDPMQDEQISTLQQRLDSLLGKSEQKTWPNVTVNGVFQADTGFFHQDDNSLATTAGFRTGPTSAGRGSPRRGD
jgi:hypothetical protein